jgi:hypothetical protein
MSKRAASRPSYIEVGSSDEDILESDSDFEKPKKKGTISSSTKKSQSIKKAKKTSSAPSSDDNDDFEEDDNSAESAYEGEQTRVQKSSAAAAPKKISAMKPAASRKSSTKFIESKEIPDPATVLKAVKNLPRRTVLDMSLLKEMVGVLEVADLEKEEVVLKIEDVIVSIVSQILKGTAFDLDVPNRSNSNQIYIEKVDRNVLGSKVSKREFLNVGQSRKVAITTRVMELIHEVLTKGIHVTKRDLFCKIAFFVT